MLNSDALFELMDSGQNDFKISSTISIIGFEWNSEILGFESEWIEKGMDVIKKYCVSESCNQIGLSNGSVEYILKIPTDYYTFNGFCEAVQEVCSYWSDQLQI